MAQAEVLNQESLAKQVLQETFGYQQFRPGQDTIIDTALAGRDCLVVMPTGGGKSLCYQVPALVLGGLTVLGGIAQTDIAKVRPAIDVLAPDYAIELGRGDALHRSQEHLEWSVRCDMSQLLIPAPQQGFERAGLLRTGCHTGSHVGLVRLGPLGQQ